VGWINVWTDSKDVPRRISYNTIGGKRSVGKRKRRWTAAVMEDSEKILGIRN
jgi:hypothetical protein